MSLKQKTLTAASWQFIDNITNNGLNFLIGIILARILEPKEFGLFSIIMVFISFSYIFVDSGFGQALIRKNKCTDDELSTVLYLNVSISVVIYFIIFYSSPLISSFFKLPDLISTLNVSALILIINALCIVQTTQFIRAMNFKLIAKISITTNLVGGLAGIMFALNGFGIWSLVAKLIIVQSLKTILFWIFNSWRPRLKFNLYSIKKIFNFSSKLVISTLIDSVYNNIFSVIIGRYFTATDLGHFSKAQQFQKLPSENITRSVTRVIYPALSQFKNNKIKLQKYFNEVVIINLFIISFFMMLMVVSAKSLILFLIGEKWLPMVPYLRLLCISGIFFTLNELIKSLIKVVGRAELLLKNELIQKIFGIPLILVSAYFGIIYIVYSIVLVSIFSFILYSLNIRSILGYSLRLQCRAVIPILSVAIISGSLTMILETFHINSILNILLLKLSLSTFLFLFLSFLFDLKSYNLLKDILKNFILSKASLSNL